MKSPYQNEFNRQKWVLLFETVPLTDKFEQIALTDEQAQIIGDFILKTLHNVVITNADVAVDLPNVKQSHPPKFFLIPPSDSPLPPLSPTIS